MRESEEVYSELSRIKDEVLACKKCLLHKERIEHGFYPVIGEGNHQAKTVFVGEAPGLQEAKTGQPFCGAAGRILDELLKSVRIKREDVYITNLIKDRPPSNRDPQPEEIKVCSPYLKRQLQIIKPKVICPLGRHSMKFLMEEFGLGDMVKPISKIHGKVFEIRSSFSLATSPSKMGSFLIPFYHPAVATYNPNMKAILKKDFQVLEKFR